MRGMRSVRLVVMAALIAVVSGCGGGGGGTGGTGGGGGNGGGTGGVYSMVTLLGRVIDAAATQSGVPNALVALTPLARDGSATRAPLTATTDETGSYSLKNAPVGRCTLQITVNDAKYKAIQIELDVPADRPSASLTCTLVPNDVNPSGIAVTPSNPTLTAGDTVQFYASIAGGSALTPFFTSTGDAGTISLNGLFTATNPGVATVTAHIGNLTADTRVTVSGSAVTGTVFGIVTMDYRPVADFVVPIGGMKASTGLDGSYHLSGLSPGSYTVSFTRGVKTFSQPITVTAGKSTRLDIGLQMIGESDLPQQPVFSALGMR